MMRYMRHISKKRNYKPEVKQTAGKAPLLLLLAMVFLLIISVKGASAVEPVALPKFTVQGSGNTSIESAKICLDHRWVLIYLTSGCLHCGDILHSIEAYKDPPFSGRVVIVVGGGTSEAVTAAFISPHDKISSIRLYADPEWQAYKALSVSGTPLIFGIREGVVEWSLSGTPWDYKAVQSTIADWIRY